MKIMKSMTTVLVICTLLFGCATMPDQTRTQAEGAGLGALVGGLIGLAIGEEEGAAIGALVGGGIGYLVGNEVAKRKKNYATTEEFLDAEIASLQEYNATALTYNEKLYEEIALLEQTSASLKADFEKGTVEKKALAAKKETLKNRMAENKKLEKTLSKELEVQTAILKQERQKRSESDSRIAQLEKEVKTLQENLTTLREGSTQLAGIDQRLSV